MKLDLRKKRFSAAMLVVLASSVVVLAPAPAAFASERPAKVMALTKKAYGEEQVQLSAYAASTAEADRLALARLLTRGRITSDSNPLRVPDLKGAITVYRGLLTASDSGIRQKSMSELADLLVRQGGSENENEAAALRQTLGKPAASEPATDEQLAAGNAPAVQENTLRDKMAAGSLDAAFDLLLLLARERPEETDTVRSQMLLMANLSALDGDSAVIRLAGRYAASLDAQKHPEALKAILALAASGGSDSLVGVIEKNREWLLTAIGKDQIRDVVWQLVDGGSTRAAELIALDLVDENVYGFDEADSKWAIEALDKAGSYRAYYVTAKLYYQGIYVEKDLDRATAAMERMLAGAADAGQERIVVADRFARMNLSDSLIAKYALPIYMDLWKAGRSSVIGRLARIVVSAEKAGFYVSAADMPMAPTQLVSELSAAYEAGDLSSGLILGDIYREGRLVPADAEKARTIYEDLRQQQADSPEMQLKLREQLAKLTRQDLEVTLAYAPYYSEVQDLAGQGDLWAMRELGLLLAKGGPQFGKDEEAGFSLLLKALSKGYLAAGPDAAEIAIAGANPDKLKQIAAVYGQFDPRLLPPESNVLLAKVDFALKQYDQADSILDSEEVQALPTGRFLLAQVRLATGKMQPEEAKRQMKDVILTFNGDDGQLLGFIQQLTHQPDSSAEFIEPVLARLAGLADRGNVNAINSAFKLRQQWKDSTALSFRKVVEWSSILAERGESGPLSRVAANVNIKVVGEDSYRYLVDKVEAALPHVPTNGNLRMFLAREYLKGQFRTKDFAKSDELIRQAAELGNEEALNSIATDYYYGQDVALDRDRAEALYRDLAFIGSNRSALALARSYSKGPSSRVYESRAFAYYIKAALNGSVTAMTEMGRSYLAGAGVELDEARGVAWLEKAAALGNTDAMIQLYYFYFIKNPTNQNPEAERWLDALVDAEVPDMIVRKAVLLHERDSKANKEQVFALLEHAEGLGSQFARRLKNAYVKQERDGGAK